MTGDKALSWPKRWKEWSVSMFYLDGKPVTVSKTIIAWRDSKTGEIHTKEVDHA